MNLSCKKSKAQSLFLSFFTALLCFSLVLPQQAVAKTGSDPIPSPELSHSSVSLRAGSAGWGAEYKARIQPHLDLRLVWQTLSPGRFEVNTGLLDEISYKAQGKFRSSGLISDWYPWTTPIRFSFGIFRNTSGFHISENPSGGEPANQYTANYGQLGYFFGTGWAPRKSTKRLTLTLDVGLMAQQPPRVTWQSDNTARTAEQTARIWSEKQLIRRELDEYKILPFLMIGLNYKIY